MDVPLFNPNEIEEQVYSGDQDLSLNLNNQCQSQGNDNFIATPSSSTQIKSPQLINDNDKFNGNAKKGKIYLTDLNTFCIPFKEGCDKYFPFMFISSGIANIIMGIISAIFSNEIKCTLLFIFIGTTIYFTLLHLHLLNFIQNDFGSI